jgi:hypothetical protein
MDKIKQIKKQNEKLAAMAAELLPKIRAFQKLANLIEDTVESTVEKYDRLEERALRKGDDWQASEYGKVVDRLYAVGDKADAICGKLYNKI